MLEDAGFVITARRGSLVGDADEPSPITPLVLVAEATDPPARRLSPRRAG